jgi:hypothetical protein
MNVVGAHIARRREANVSFEIATQLKYVGYWVIDGPHGFKIATRHKPNWFNKLCVKFMFGWTWEKVGSNGF